MNVFGSFFSTFLDCEDGVQIKHRSRSRYNDKNSVYDTVIVVKVTDIYPVQTKAFQNTTQENYFQKPENYLLYSEFLIASFGT